MPYLAIIEDRHTSVEVVPFHSAENAIAYAKEQAVANARHPVDPDDEDQGEQQIDEWLFCYVYSSEGDSVHVVEVDWGDDPQEIGE